MKKNGKLAVVAANRLEQQFDVQVPNQVWLTDITYIRTHESWLYLAVVLDLFSRQVVGWSMQSPMETDLALNALLIAVWRQQPKSAVTIHSDQDSQCRSRELQAFRKAHNLVASKSLRGNCCDHAVADSFFQLLKWERIRRKIYTDREEAQRSIFDYIELFYNPKYRHGYAGRYGPGRV